MSVTPHLMSEFIAHRGLMGEGRENSLDALREASHSGFSWVEVDAMPTQDGVAMGSHDDSLERVFGIDLVLSSVPYSVVRERVPITEHFAVLEGLINFASFCRMNVNVDIKPGPATGREAVENIMKKVTRPSMIKYVVSSFSVEVLEHARATGPSAHLALITHELRPGWEEEARRVGAGNIHLGLAGASRDGSCEQVKEAGYGLYVFTVNDAETHQRLRERGVDGVFTDTPALMGKPKRP